MIAKGLIIRESLRDGTMPSELIPRIVDQYTHALGGGKGVEIIVLKMDQSEVPSAAFLLAKHLVDEEYYAHFVCGNRLCVVFPNIVCFVIKGDKVSLERSLSIGRLCKVPDDQMPFEAMFEVDHPNAHT